MKGDTTRLHRERVRKHIFCVQYLTRGLDPPAQHLPGYNRAARASSKKDNGWFKPVPQKKIYGKPAQKFRKRKKKKRDWQMDTTSDDTDEEAYYSAKPKATAVGHRARQFAWFAWCCPYLARLCGLPGCRCAPVVTQCKSQAEVVQV